VLGQERVKGPALSAGDALANGKQDAMHGQAQDNGSCRNPAAPQGVSPIDQVMLHEVISHSVNSLCCTGSAAQAFNAEILMPK
jgi:hypothetical protein